MVAVARLDRCVVTGEGCQYANRDLGYCVHCPGVTAERLVSEGLTTIDHDQGEARTPAAAALWMNGMGFNTLPIEPGTKKPVASAWRQWQEKPMTPTDVSRLMWRNSDRIGLVNGPGGLRAMDFDGCPSTGPVYAALEALGLPEDYRWVEESDSGTGYHIFFICTDALPAGALPQKDREANTSVFRGEAKDKFVFDHLEVRWGRCQTIVAATKDASKWLHDEPDGPPAPVTATKVVAAFNAVAQGKPASAPPKAGPGADITADDAKERIRAAFDMVAYAELKWGKVEREGNEVRVTGHGGLLIRPAKGVWYRFSGEVGGDCFDLVGYALYDDVWNRTDKRMFRAALVEASGFTRIPLPDREREPTQLYPNALDDESDRGAQPVDAPPLTDMGNGERFAAQHLGRVVWLPEHNQWFAFDGTRWREGDGTETYALVKETIRGIDAEASPEMSDDERKAVRKWSKASESARGVNAMFSCAKQEKGIAATLDQFDADPWALNVANGTIDLHSGARRPHNAADRQKKLAPVEYHADAQCPLWLKTVETIFAGDAGLVQLLRRAFGYTLTGSTREQKLFLLHGDGDNGKSTILNVLGEILGEYGGATDMKLLTTARGGDSSKAYYFADLAGSRFVSAVEPDESAHLDEATIKLLTGTDQVPARFPYGRPFAFMPKFKLFLSFNERPEIKGTNHGIWRRPVLIPFGVRFTDDGAGGTPRKDMLLADKLRAEYPGILAWAVQGCLDWQRDGLAVPEISRIALNEYREDMDDFGAFLIDRCEDVPGYIEDAGELYKAYDAWCFEGGVRARMTATKFGRTLGARNYPKGWKPNGDRARIGIRVRARTGF